MSNARRVIGSLTIAGLVSLAAPTTLAQDQSTPGQAQSNNAQRTESARPAGITAKQMENVALRIATAQAIVTRLRADAISADGVDPAAWQQATIDSLLALPLSALQRVGAEAYSAEALSAAIARTHDDPELIGDTDEDLVYFPITPCRFGDTRAVGGRIDGIRGFDVVNNGATYGGLASCNPTALFGVGENSFGALALNVTIVDPTVAPGFVAVKPTAASPVTSLLNWYQAGASVQAANLGIVTLDQSGNLDEYVVQTSAPVHVIQDIFGAFLAPHATALSITEVSSATTPIGAGAGITLPFIACPAGYSVTGGGVDADQFGVYTVESRSDVANNRWVCAVNNTTGAVATARCTATCARVPGR